MCADSCVIVLVQIMTTQLILEFIYRVNMNKWKSDIQPFF